MADERKTADVPLDAKRFAALADAYGGALHRWPAAEQAAAILFAGTDEGRAVLRRADSLDTMLDRHRVEAPNPTLYGAIVSGAVTAVRQERRRRFWWLGDEPSRPRAETRL